MSQYRSDVKAPLDLDKVVSVLCYFTVVGWLISVVLFGKNRSAHARFHLRQSLGLIITSAILAFIPLIGWALQFVLLGFWLTALYQSIVGHQYTIPVLGDFYQEHLDFIA